MAKPKLTKNSRAVKLLRTKFQNGEITPDLDPKDVWQSSDIFQKHGLDRFRTCFTNMRKEFEKQENDDEGENLKRKCTFVEGSSGTKKRRISDISAESDEDDSDGMVGIGSEIVVEDLSFKPLYQISSWIEPGTMTKRLAVAIVLPSGIGPGHFSVRVADNGGFVELSVVWPAPLMHPEILHKKWLPGSGDGSIQSYHPKIIGFQNSLKQLRQRSSDLIESTARIALPFNVQTHIETKFNLGWRENGTKVVYLNLKAFVEEYAVQNDCEEFEML